MKKNYKMSQTYSETNDAIKVKIQKDLLVS